MQQERPGHTKGGPPRRKQRRTLGHTPAIMSYRRGVDLRCVLRPIERAPRHPRRCEGVAQGIAHKSRQWSARPPSPASHHMIASPFSRDQDNVTTITASAFPIRRSEFRKCFAMAKQGSSLGYSATAMRFYLLNLTSESLFVRYQCSKHAVGDTLLPNAVASLPTSEDNFILSSSGGSSDIMLEKSVFKL